MSLMISIIMPVFNTLNEIDEAILSILNQSYKNFELVIVNDGSTHKTLKHLKYWELKDKRIIILNQENMGQAYARINGLKLARGDIVTFVDSDDLVSTDYLKHLTMGFINDSIDITAVKYREFKNNIITNINHNNYTKKVFDSHSYLYRVLLYNNGIYNVGFWGKAFRKDFLTKQSLPKGHVYEDLAAMPEIISSARKIYWIDSYDYFYRYRKNSTTKSYSNEKYQDLLWALDKVKTLVNKNSYLYNPYKVLVFNHLTFFWIWSIKNKKKYDDIVKKIDSISLSFLYNCLLKGIHVSIKGLFLLTIYRKCNFAFSFVSNIFCYYL